MAQATSQQMTALRRLAVEVRRKIPRGTLNADEADTLIAEFGTLTRHPPLTDVQIPKGSGGRKRDRRARVGR